MGADAELLPSLRCSSVAQVSHSACMHVLAAQKNTNGFECWLHRGVGEGDVEAPTPAACAVCARLAALRLFRCVSSKHGWHSGVGIGHCAQTTAASASQHSSQTAALVRWSRSIRAAAEGTPTESASDSTVGSRQVGQSMTVWPRLFAWTTSRWVQAVHSVWAHCSRRGI